MPSITPLSTHNGIVFGLDQFNILYWLTEFGSWCPVTAEQAQGLAKGTI